MAYTPFPITAGQTGGEVAGVERSTRSTARPAPSPSPLPMSALTLPAWQPDWLTTCRA